MSWSMSTVLKHEHTDVGLQKNLDALNAIDRTNVGNQHCVKERDEQIDTAIHAVHQIIVEGGFSNAAEITVSMSGHANPNHETANGWSNESINISVYVKSYKTD